ncbi:MAG: PH domain-containing protein [Mucilaginibacter polytrichastri]|nr:PH domain-containing protein [Mucilaginibacter polytrichastri]
MIERFLNEQQDPKSVEKVYARLVDLLTTNEEILYISVQKKPVVNITPDCVALTNKRVFFFSPANLGLSMKFTDVVWKDVADVHIKEEILGSVFIVKTMSGAELSVDYLPKVQARKLYQFGQEQEEKEREIRRERELEERRAGAGQFNFAPGKPMETVPEPERQPEPIPVNPPPAPAAPDELTQKLQKLKRLFDASLITEEEYQQKKQQLLSEL